MKSRNVSILYFSFLIAYTVQLFAATSTTIALTETASGTSTTSSTPPVTVAKPVEKTPADKKATDDKKTVEDKADKSKTDKEKADKEAADKIAADKEKADKEAADKKIADDKAAADKATADKEKADKDAADKAAADKTAAATPPADTADKTAAVPTVETKAQQILISVYIQNNFTQDAKLNQIELLTSKKTEPFIKSNLNIPIPASKSLYSKGSITAFDLTADRNSVETFNGIQSITINDDKLTFNNVKTGSSLSNPIKITQKDGHWVLDK